MSFCPQGSVVVQDVTLHGVLPQNSTISQSSRMAMLQRGNFCSQAGCPHHIFGDEPSNKLSYMFWHCFWCFWGCCETFVSRFWTSWGGLAAIWEAKSDNTLAKIARPPGRRAPADSSTRMPPSGWNCRGPCFLSSGLFLELWGSFWDLALAFSLRFSFSSSFSLASAFPFSFSSSRALSNLN